MATYHVNMFGKANSNYNTYVTRRLLIDMQWLMRLLYFLFTFIRNIV